MQSGVGQTGWAILRSVERLVGLYVGITGLGNRPRQEAQHKHLHRLGLLLLPFLDDADEEVVGETQLLRQKGIRDNALLWYAGAQRVVLFFLTNGRSLDTCSDINR